MRIADDLIAYLTDTPQPVALALGRVVRANGIAPRLEACLKAAEVIARYVAVVGLASAASAPDREVAPLKIEGFGGDLSFGSFEMAARAAYGTKWNHPLRDRLKACLRSTKKRKSLAGTRLESFVQLRNQLGHALMPADEPRARAIFEEKDPIAGLIDMISGLEPILSLPLVVVLDQQHRRGRFQARMAVYVGEGEPIPREVRLLCGIHEWESPYLCTEQGVIRVTPGLLFHPQADGRFGLYLIDGIGPSDVRYKSVYDNSVATTNRTISDLVRWVELPFEVQAAHQSAPAIEEVGLEDGRTLLGFVRGAPVPPKAAKPSGATITPAVVGAHRGSETVSSVSEFERESNIAGVGSAYRDIVYFLLGLGHRAEISETGIRIVTSGDPSRVLLTATLGPGPELVVTILSGAFRRTGGEQKTVVEVLKPNQSADEVIKFLESLIRGGAI